MGNTLLTTPAAGAFHWAGTPDYIADEVVSAVVNLAIRLGRPLLLLGEPGTGKTTLAESVARGLGIDLVRWTLRSDAHVAQGLACVGNSNTSAPQGQGEPGATTMLPAVRLGPLAQAFAAPARTVLLIDDLDRAPPAFAADLASALDDAVRDGLANGRTPQSLPIVFLTCDRDHALPPALLRRCIVCVVDFPDSLTLSRIVRVHLHTVETPLLAAAIARLSWLRKTVKLPRPPSTAELIDWITALHSSGISPETVQAGLPFPGVLLKSPAEMKLVAERLLDDGEGR